MSTLIAIDTIFSLKEKISQRKHSPPSAVKIET